MEPSLQMSIRKQLLSAAAAGSAAFEISGVLELSQPLDVYFKDHNNQPVCVSHPACTCNRLGCSGSVLHLHAVVGSKLTELHHCRPWTGELYEHNMQAADLFV
jgi:hypothetical protein